MTAIVEPTVVAAVWRRELSIFKKYWATTSFAALFEPSFMLVTFGVGFGSLVARVAGYRYMDFVATGIVGIATLFTSVFPAMFNTYIRRTFQHSYDAMLAAPVDVHELVAGEASWTSIKSGVFSCAPVLVGIAFGLRVSAGMLVIPLITCLTASVFCLFGMWVSTFVPSINSFDFVITGIVTPVMLVAGTFFPVSSLPGWARVAAHVNPLYHCVALVRDAVFGFHPLDDLGHVGVLIAFSATMGFLAISGMRRRLID
jgi:lipooligosaccharide transport system permease protein